jgi:hypothetical protein
MLPLPGLSSASGKSVVVKFDGGLLSSDGGVLALREIETRLWVADRLAVCVVDPRALEQITHNLADIIRFRLLMIGARHEDAIDANCLRSDPMFKMALDLTPSDRELCSQSTISRLENLPDVRALMRLGRAMVDLYCEPFAKVPKRITLDIDDTFDAVHGGQQLRLFNARYDEYGFQPIVVFDGEGRFVTAVLRPAKRPSGKGSSPSCAGSCAPSALTGPTSKSCCAPTATAAARKFSTGVGRTASTISSASRRPRPCVAISRVSKPARRRGSRPPPLRAASCGVSRSSMTPPRVGAGSNGSSLASKSAWKDPTAASSSPTCKSATPARSTKTSTADAATPKTTSSPGRRIWPPTAHPARKRPPISSGYSCTPAPIG